MRHFRLFLQLVIAYSLTKKQNNMGNACTGLAAPADDFATADLPKMGATVSTVRVYASALVWINFLLLTALLLVSLVPGAALGGSPVDFAALPHIVWFIPNFLMLAFVIHAVANSSYIDVDGFKVFSNPPDACGNYFFAQLFHLQDHDLFRNDFCGDFGHYQRGACCIVGGGMRTTNQHLLSARIPVSGRDADWICRVCALAAVDCRQALRVPRDGHHGH